MIDLASAAIDLARRDAVLSASAAPDGMRDTVTVLQTFSGLVAAKRIRLRPGEVPSVTGYDNAEHFKVHETTVDGLVELAALLVKIEQRPDRFIIRGRPREGIDRQRAHRRLYPTDNKPEPPCFEEAPRRWILLDFDDIPCPAGFDPLADPDATVRHVVSHLPIEFHGASCWWQFTSSAGIKPGIRIRLGYWGSRALSGQELKDWMPSSIVDHSVFNPVQPIYVARPIFEEGDDPVPVRSGIFRGGRCTVEVPDTITAPTDGGPAFTFSALPAKLQKMIKGDAAAYGGDRSRLLWGALVWLGRLGWPTEHMLGVVLNPQHETLFRHCQEQGDPHAYARKQIEKALAAAAELGGAWELTADGAIVANSQANVRKALGLAGYALSYDEFSLRMLINGCPLDDTVVIEAWLAIDERFKFRPNRAFFDAVVVDEAHRRSFHPLRAYLDAVRWDGEPRIDRWLTTYGSAEDNEYTRAVGRLTLVAAVRRARKPGCKFDEMLVLVDPQQGTDKSSALSALCPDPDWFTDSLNLGGDDKEVIERIAGKWIVEVPELAGMKRGDIEKTKAFQSRQVDRARLAYGRFRTEVPRQCVFFGTTNESVFLKDSQNRRYWPVGTGVFDVAAITRDRDQLWAEAAAAEAKGESIRLDKKLWPMAREVQEEHKAVDPWLYTVEKVLGDKNGRIKTASLFEILMIPASQQTSAMSSRLASCMRELQWDNNKGKVIRFGAKVLRGYMRGDETERQREITVTVDPIMRTVTAAEHEAAKNVTV